MYYIEQTPLSFISSLASCSPLVRGSRWEGKGLTSANSSLVGGIPGVKGLRVRRISTFLEVLLSAALFILGLYLVHLAISADSEYGVVILVGGAVSFTLGQMTLVFAVKSILWHRHMLRHSVPKDNVDRPKGEYGLR